MRLDRRRFLIQGASVAVGLAATPTSFGKTTPNSLSALAARMSGPLIVPSDSAYATARLPYNERYDHVHPVAVARPRGVGDLREIVRWARRTNTQLAVRSGGHSYAGYSVTSGLVVDLGALDTVSLAPSGVATVGAGARLVDVEAALAAHGRAIVAGSCATVGIGGLALGGGIGFASRRHGTTSDNVASLGIVTADGRFRTASQAENPDLLWACRGGGGGNFGIVTHFDVRTFPTASVSYFFASWPWSRANAVIDAWQRFAPHAPDDLFTICAVQTGTSSPSIRVFGQLLGSESRLRSLLGPLTAVDGISLSTGASGYLDAQLRWSGCLGKTLAACHIAGESPGGTLGRSAFTAKSDYLHARLGSSGIATITHWIEQAQHAGFGSASLLLDSYGGAINRMSRSATAFVHRDAIASGQYLAYWYHPEGESGALAWTRGFHKAMRPHVSGFAYQNYIDPDLTEWRNAYYGENADRLEAIKAKIDPSRVFRFKQGIVPS